MHKNGQTSIYREAFGELVICGLSGIDTLLESSQMMMFLNKFGIDARSMTPSLFASHDLYV